MERVGKVYLTKRKEKYTIFFFFCSHNMEINLYLIIISNTLHFLKDLSNIRHPFKTNLGDKFQTNVTETLRTLETR